MFEVAGPTPLPRPPRNLPGHAVIRETADDAIDAAAADFLLQAHNCVRAFGDFHLAVAPQGLEHLLQRLMYDPALRELPWQKTQLWLVEDTALPPENPARASTLLSELVAMPADVPAHQIHVIPVENSDAADLYERQIREHLGWREKGHDRLDCVLLGMPPAALAGVSPTAHDDESLVRTFVREGEPPITSMTHRLIRASRFVSVLAVGEQCREAFARVSAGLASEHDDARSFPCSKQKLLGGEMRWYMDIAACPPGPELTS